MRAAGAHDRVCRRRRKFAALDSINRVDETRLCVGERRILRFAPCEHWHELPILAERDIAGLPWLPILATGLSQVLDCADGVDRQLQRLLAIWRPAQLVVDDAERPILEQIDPIGFSAQRDTPRSCFGLNIELALERLLQQPLAHGCVPLSLELKHCLGQPFIGGRTEKPCALYGRFVLGQLREQGLDHVPENQPSLRQILRRDAEMSLAVPFFKKFLEDFVDENPELFRVERGFVFGILLEAEDTLRKESERALKVPLERADAVR